MNIKDATQMAKDYGLKSSVAFNKLLCKCGILTAAGGGGYVLAEELRQLGYVAIINKPFWLPNGIRATKKKAAWTEAGQEYLRQRLSRLGIMPVCEQRGLFDN